jgi:hypothetical protein
MFQLKKNYFSSTDRVGVQRLIILSRTSWCKSITLVELRQTRERNMKTVITVVAFTAMTLSIGSVALAQEFDPNPLNRYPAYSGPVTATRGALQWAPVALSRQRGSQAQRNTYSGDAKAMHPEVRAMIESSKRTYVPNAGLYEWRQSMDTHSGVPPLVSGATQANPWVDRTKFQAGTGVRR